jgi:hypothetical protein
MKKSILNLSIVMSTKEVSLPRAPVAIALHPYVSGWMHQSKNGSLTTASYPAKFVQKLSQKTKLNNPLVRLHSSTVMKA